MTMIVVCGLVLAHRSLFFTLGSFLRSSWWLSVSLRRIFLCVSWILKWVAVGSDVFPSVFASSFPFSCYPPFISLLFIPHSFLTLLSSIPLSYFFFSLRPFLPSLPRSSFFSSPPPPLSLRSSLSLPLYPIFSSSSPPPPVFLHFLNYLNLLLLPLLPHHPYFTNASTQHRIRRLHKRARVFLYTASRTEKGSNPPDIFRRRVSSPARIVRYSGEGTNGLWKIRLNAILV